MNGIDKKVIFLVFKFGTLPCFTVPFHISTMGPTRTYFFGSIQVSSVFILHNVNGTKIVAGKD